MPRISPWPYPGARWWRMDFHAHTPASLDTRAWQRAIGTNDAVTPERWLLWFMQRGIDCVAITDHNTGEWIDPLKEAYERLKAQRPETFRELHLFPGVEISVNGGFHLLAIFDKDATTADIHRLLGRVGYEGRPGSSDGVTSKSPIEVIHAILDAGGLPIPAHVDKEKGLFTAIHDANTLKQILECPDIIAAEVIDPSFEKPGIYTHLGVRWAEVLGSDCHTFRGANVATPRYTWVKMAEPCLEGLRLALLDGDESSIRRSDASNHFDPFALPDHFIESITISEARFMGHGTPSTLSFSPWFNAIVGGRGTGKSSVINFLRIAYRRTSDLEKLKEDDEARRAFERFNKVPTHRYDAGALTNSTEISVTLMRNGIRHRLRWQQDGTGPDVEEERDGYFVPSSNQVIGAERFPVRILSQGEIASLAGDNQEALLALIDEAAGTADAKRAFEEEKSRYLSLRARLRELDSKLASRSSLAVRLDDLRRALHRFREARYAETVQEYQRRIRQEQELDRQATAVTDMATRVEQLAAALVPEAVPPGIFAVDNVEDRQAVEILDQLHTAIKNASFALESTARALRAAAAQARESWQRSTWWVEVERAKHAYKELNEQGFADPNYFDTLLEELRRVEEELRNLDKIQNERNDTAILLEQQYRRLLEARRRISKQRQSFLRGVLADNPHVRITLLPYGRNPLVIERSLRAVLDVADDRFGNDILVMEGSTPKGGLVADLLRDISDDDTEHATNEMENRIQRLKERIARACLGEDEFGGHFNNYLKRKYANRPEFLDRLLAWFPEDSLLVEYSPDGDGREFRPISQASVGQRAAAMLAFLLAHGTEPLVLDQPEDDLDNRLIYDLVVKQIRSNKLRRQLIVVTHNPNIVVNGDAELIHVLEFYAGQCHVVTSGALQDAKVQDDICRTMEGGREAFERRWRRLGQARARVSATR